MRKVFISYSSEDKDFVREIHAGLQSLEVRGFLDNYDVVAGQGSSEQMRMAISEADAVVLVVSIASLESRWVLAEIGAAESLRKRIIPVVVPGEVIHDKELMPALRDKQLLFADKRRVLDLCAVIIATIEDIEVTRARDVVGSTLAVRERAKRKWLVVTASIVSLTLALVGMVVIAKRMSLRPAPSSNAEVMITTIPFSRQGGPDEGAEISGTVEGTRPDGARIVVYAYAGDRWWVQPFDYAPFTEVNRDGKWRSATHLGTRYAALLVMPGYKPPMNVSSLPEVGAGVLAFKDVVGERISDQ